MLSNALFTSKTDNWSTPQWLFDQLNAEFNFVLDVCANETNKKCDKYYSIDQNGLKSGWLESNWMNPPYGRSIGDWVKKAYSESFVGKLTVGLLPARTDTRWFHDYIYGKSEIRFIKGRLRFGNSNNNAPFSSMIVIWHPLKEVKYA